MNTFIAAVAMGWLLIWCAEPALAQGCYTQTYMINGKIMVCTVCPGFTSCN